LREPIEARGDLPPIAATLKKELKRERARRPSRSGIICIHGTDRDVWYGVTTNLIRTSVEARFSDDFVEPYDHRCSQPPRQLCGRLHLRVYASHDLDLLLSGEAPTRTSRPGME
jgi:hypothetical protein